MLATIVSLDPIHFVFDVSEADYLRYTPPLPSRRARARRATRRIPVRMRLADETDWTRRGKVDFVDNELSPRSGTIRTRAVVDNKDQLADARHLRPRAALRRRIRCAADPRRRRRLRPGAQDRVHGRRRQQVVRQAGDAGPIVDGLRVVRDGLAPTDQVVLDGLANPMVRPGAKVVARRRAIDPADGQFARDA